MRKLKEVIAGRELAAITATQSAMDAAKLEPKVVRMILLAVAPMVLAILGGLLILWLLH